MKRLLILIGAGILLGGGLAAWAATAGPSATDAAKLKVATPGPVLEVDVGGKKVAIPPLKEVAVGDRTLETKGIKLHGQGKDTKNRPAVWRLDGIKPFGDLEKIEVSGPDVTTIEGGAPLTILTPVGVSVKNGQKTLTVGLHIIGKAKEHYSTVAYMGLIRASNPKIAIVDESGKVLHTGSYEYG
ncbi:MAG: hypothetical protein ISS74_07020 [Planctomycetes bacterium]|nr:hypothetical protein [Planctomycetota bacterium]